ncbi:MAG: hypothetical protein K0Q95_1137 [Bacteroidota bacterium]|jgi:hypothetical protein|nr:hypothetical protein [Bacteroidota bacterium]
MDHIKIVFAFSLLLLPAIALSQKKVELNTVEITASGKIDTVFGTWKFSVADYEFYEDKLVLLTYTKNMKMSSVKLVDRSQKILSSFEIPDESESLYKDYMGFINVICKKDVFRIKINNDIISLASLPSDQFKERIMPCLDTLGKDIYFSNYSKEYPEFTYYAYSTVDSVVHPFKTVTNVELLRDYNMEYYFMKPKEKVLARNLAEHYKVDFHRVAVMMTGLTSSIFYEPLYAPLFIINDTVVVFDHYSNSILSYNKRYELLDSVTITYNHPKNWREWKHEIIVDKDNHKVYAKYQKNGFYYLKQIDRKTGKIIGSFKLHNQYVEHIKVKGDYVYYVYRPFESLQEQFVYKELIRN